MSQRTRTTTTAMAAHIDMQATSSSSASSASSSTPSLTLGTGSQGTLADMEMERVRAVGNLDLEYIVWNLPKSEPGEKRGRTSKGIVLTPLALFTPGSSFLLLTSSSSGSSSSSTSWVKKRCSSFTSTPSTRAVRDIKRPNSWKLYGTSCNPTTAAEPHFIRLVFSTTAADAAFTQCADLLNSLAAKRFLQSSRTAREKIHPFGIGFDCGVQKSKERLYIISNCAKQTPYLRRVAVSFEHMVDGEWQRTEATVDRIGFATYKSAPKSAVLAASTLDAITFKDDAYLRFARVTLRFGAQAERTVLDLGRGFEPHLQYGKTATTITMKKVRVRTCEGSRVSSPMRTQVRLVFTDMKESRGRTSGAFRRNSGVGRHAAGEAEKVLGLLQKTVALAAVNTLGLEDDLEDDAIFQMNIQRVVTAPGFTARRKGAEVAERVQGLGAQFRNSTLFLVPCFESNGVKLVLQSRNGEYVLRQYINSPVRFIGSITSTSFTGSHLSTLVKHTHEHSGLGVITYMFETQETDATSLVEILVSIIEKLHMFHTTVTTSLPDPATIVIPAAPSRHILSRAGSVLTRHQSTRARAPPEPAEISIPPTTTTTALYKVPRKPVPAHSRSTSAPPLVRESATGPPQQQRPPRTSSHNTSGGGRRLYELRAVRAAAATLKSMDTVGFQGTVQKVSSSGIGAGRVR